MQWRIAQTDLFTNGISNFKWYESLLCRAVVAGVALAALVTQTMTAIVIRGFQVWFVGYGFCCWCCFLFFSLSLSFCLFVLFCCLLLFVLDGSVLLFCSCCLLVLLLLKFPNSTNASYSSSRSSDGNSSLLDEGGTMPHYDAGLMVMCQCLRHDVMAARLVTSCMPIV